MAHADCGAEPRAEALSEARTEGESLDAIAAQEVAHAARREAPCAHAGECAGLHEATRFLLYGTDFLSIERADLFGECIEDLSLEGIGA